MNGTSFTIVLAAWVGHTNRIESKSAVALAHNYRQISACSAGLLYRPISSEPRAIIELYSSGKARSSEEPRPQADHRRCDDIHIYIIYVYIYMNK